MVTRDIQKVGREESKRMRCGEKSGERLRKKRDIGAVKRVNPKSFQHRKIGLFFSILYRYEMTAVL